MATQVFVMFIIRTRRNPLKLPADKLQGIFGPQGSTIYSHRPLTPQQATGNALAHGSKGRPNMWLMLCSLLIVFLAVILPFTPLGRYFGFVPPPLSFYAILTGLVFFYLFAVEGIKQWFFRRFAER